MHSPGQLFIGAKLFIRIPSCETRPSMKIKLFEMCENAWQPLADARMGIRLQNVSYLSCF